MPPSEDTRCDIDGAARDAGARRIIWLVCGVGETVIGGNCGFSLAPLSAWTENYGNDPVWVRCLRLRPGVVVRSGRT
jgi:hypothetical protein